jgi:phthalate 4,5-dioxygenase
MVYNWSYCPDGPLTDEDKLERGLGNGPMHVDPKTFRSAANRENDYLLDRLVQKSETYTGIDGINVQDRAIQESMGRICDRSKEHLGPADKAIIQARKLLRQAVKTVEAGGMPDGTGTSYYPLRAHEAVLPRSTDWRVELTPEMNREAILQTV